MPTNNFIDNFEKDNPATWTIESRELYLSKMLGDDLFSRYDGFHPESNAGDCQELWYRLVEMAFKVEVYGKKNVDNGEVRFWCTIKGRAFLVGDPTVKFILYSHTSQSHAIVVAACRALIERKKENE